MTNGVDGMVLYKRSGRFCPRISTDEDIISEIRGRWRWEALSVCVVARPVTFKFACIMNMPNILNL
ncbi:hypothetical protein ABEW32_24125 [Paenibacillus jamilae]|uniref:hypothetical protein n=1 Tax=Paenibacillus jamilae TaxID=114136 RepID=UPI003D2A92A5